MDKTPDITFALDSATPAGDGARVAGSLTVRGNTRQVAFDAQGASPGDELWLTARVPVTRSDYGLNWNMLGIAAMKSEMAITAVFTRG